jgi:sulfoxide reductase heme-binding subunit YedZ
LAEPSAPFLLREHPAGPCDRKGHMRGYTLDRPINAVTGLTCASPLACELWASRSGNLAAQNHLLAHTGLRGLRLLVLTLTVRPAAQLLQQRRMIRYRRIVGLFAFAYITVHAVAYLLPGQLWRDPIALIVQPYLAVGIAAFILLIPVAATSSNAVARRIGGKVWKRIHQAIYVIAPLSVLHHVLANGGPSEGAVDGGLIGVLLAYRIYDRRKLRQRLPVPEGPALERLIPR